MPNTLNSSAPYPPAGVVATVAEFFAARNMMALAPPLDRDRIVSDMAHGYVRLDARRATPRGARDYVVLLVLSSDGKYAQNGPALRSLLTGIVSETAVIGEGRLDELIVVAEEEFFGKKNVMDVFREFAAAAGAGRSIDAAGRAPYCNAYPFHVFAMNIPAHLSVPPHRLMAPEEVADLLATQRKQLRDLPSIYASDPPVIWCGGREGHVVEITRPSEVASRAMYYRRVVARPI